MQYANRIFQRAQGAGFSFVGVIRIIGIDGFSKAQLGAFRMKSAVVYVRHGKDDYVGCVHGGVSCQR